MSRSYAWRLRSLLPLLVVLSGCSTTAEDIERWKGTREGPHRLMEVVRDHDEDLDLVVAAMVALIEMPPRGEPQYRAWDDPLEALLNGVSNLMPGRRREVLDAFGPELVRLIRGGVTAEGDERPSPRMVRAKDVAVDLLEHYPNAVEGVRDDLASAVVVFYFSDYAYRARLGRYSAEQAFEHMGEAGPEHALEGLHARASPQALPVLTWSIVLYGDEDTRQRASDRLAVVREELDSRELHAWFYGKATDALNAHGPGATRVRVERLTETWIQQRREAIDAALRGL